MSYRTSPIVTRGQKPSPPPVVIQNGERLKHIATYTSPVSVGWLWWKKVAWEHSYEFASEAELRSRSVPESQFDLDTISVTYTEAQ